LNEAGACASSFIGLEGLKLARVPFLNCSSHKVPVVDGLQGHSDCRIKRNKTVWKKARMLLSQLLVMLQLFPHLYLSVLVHYMNSPSTKYLANILPEASWIKHQALEQHHEYIKLGLN